MLRLASILGFAILMFPVARCPYQLRLASILGFAILAAKKHREEIKLRLASILGFAILKCPLSHFAIALRLASILGFAILFPCQLIELTGEFLVFLCKKTIKTVITGLVKSLFFVDFVPSG